MGNNTINSQKQSFSATLTSETPPTDTTQNWLHTNPKQKQENLGHLHLPQSKEKKNYQSV